VKQGGWWGDSRRFNGADAADLGQQQEVWWGTCRRIGGRVSTLNHAGQGSMLDYWSGFGTLSLSAVTETESAGSHVCEMGQPAHA
jgi:hypothetical protein